MTSVSDLRRVGRYEIVREIGRGGTAVVYLARQTDLDRSVALKELAAFRASDPAFVERFLRESRVTGALNHPNIVTVHEYFEHEGTPFIAMEYFERGSLRPHVGHLDLPQIGGVLEGLLAGLAHAETRGIVHRDLKPENVLVTSAGGVKIADFGMAKARELTAASELTASGTTVGTPAYMAPEQALASAVGPATDLYSVGVIAYELLSGRVPFDRIEAPIATMLRHLNDEVPPLLRLRPELDPALVSCVERLLAKKPEDRPASAAEAWEELEELVIATEGPRWRRRGRLLTGDATAAVSEPAEAATPGTVRVTRKLPTGRRRTWAALLAIGILGAGGAGAAFVLADNSSSATPSSEQTTSSEAGGKTNEEPPPRIIGPLLTKIALTDEGDPVTVMLRLSKDRLGAGDIVVRDADLADGRALLLVRRRGITARTGGGTFGPLSLLVRKARGLLRIDVAADGGAFSTLQARRLDGHRILLSFDRPEPTTSGESTGNTTTTTTTTTPITQPPHKKKNDKPAIDTG